MSHDRAYSNIITHLRRDIAKGLDKCFLWLVRGFFLCEQTKSNNMFCYSCIDDLAGGSPGHADDDDDGDDDPQGRDLSARGPGG